jgi:hypothetical protein
MHRRDHPAQVGHSRTNEVPVCRNRYLIGTSAYANPLPSRSSEHLCVVVVVDHLGGRGRGGRERAVPAAVGEVGSSGHPAKPVGQHPAAQPAVRVHPLDPPGEARANHAVRGSGQHRRRQVFDVLGEVLAVRVQVHDRGGPAALPRPARAGPPRQARLTGWASTVAPAWQARVADASVEPSSTTITTTGRPPTRAGIRATTSPTMSCSLWTGRNATTGAVRGPRRVGTGRAGSLRGSSRPQYPGPGPGARSPMHQCVPGLHRVRGQRDRGTRRRARRWRPARRSRQPCTSRTHPGSAPRPGRRSSPRSRHRLRRGQVVAGRDAICQITAASSAQASSAASASKMPVAPPTARTSAPSAPQPAQPPEPRHASATGPLAPTTATGRPAPPAARARRPGRAAPRRPGQPSATRLPTRLPAELAAGSGAARW